MFEEYSEFESTPDFANDIGGLIKSWKVGSTVTCDPPVQNTDIDYLVLFEKGNFMLSSEWLLGGGGNYDFGYSDFNSFRNGNKNLIVTSDPLFIEKFLQASKIAKRLNLLDKEDRIYLFQAILYGNYDV